MSRHCRKDLGQRNSLVVLRSLGTTLAALMILASVPAHAAEAPVPQNRIAIMVDLSGSYRKRLEEAMSKVSTLLEGLAERRVKRWETPAQDVVAVFSLDAMPEKVWEGSLEEIKGILPSDWQERLKSRSDYAQCTDVGRAFQEAARFLEGDPEFVDRYLFVFSDLVHEPPKKSIRKCERARSPSPPPEDFPWEAFAGVSVMAMWVPADQKFAWHRAVETRGLQDTFRLFTESESETVAIEAPPRPVVEVSAEEEEAAREEARQAVATATTRIGKGLLWVGGAVAFLLLLGILLPRLRGRRHAASRSTGRPRPAAGSGGRPRPADPHGPNGSRSPVAPRRAPPPAGTTGSPNHMN